MQEYFASSLGSFSDIPNGVLGKGMRNADYINKPFVDLYSLIESDEFKFTTMKEIFQPEGKLKNELLDYLEEYITSKANSLGVEMKEIEDILKQ